MWALLQVVRKSHHAPGRLRAAPHKGPMGLERWFVVADLSADRSGLPRRKRIPLQSQQGRPEARNWQRKQTSCSRMESVTTPPVGRWLA